MNHLNWQRLISISILTPTLLLTIPHETIIGSALTVILIDQLAKLRKEWHEEGE